MAHPLMELSHSHPQQPQLSFLRSACTASPLLVLSWARMEGDTPGCFSDLGGMLCLGTRKSYSSDLPCRRSESNIQLELAKPGWVFLWGFGVCSQLQSLESGPISNLMLPFMFLWKNFYIKSLKMEKWEYSFPLGLQQITIYSVA